MKLSTKGRYAVMALYDLAREGQGKVVCLQEISQRQNISLAYLEQLFSSLRRADLVESVRGARGGYTLKRKPGDISMAMIMHAANESFKSTRCSASAKAGCMDKGATCATHHLWSGLENVINNYFTQISLDDLVKGQFPGPKEYKYAQ